MSGLAGAFDPSGRPIDRALFHRVLSRVAYRGPDGIRSCCRPGVAMAFARFIRTPDAVFDRQPLVDDDAGTCVTFDGRLDNREELAAEAGVRLTDDTCDAALAAAAYRRWGLDFAARLLGDFSLAVWDGRTRQLLLARDVMGVRPLFYRQLGGVWWWASDQRALLEPGMPPVNEAFVGELLCGRVAAIDETIYQGIYRMPMAHALLVSERGDRRWRYWRPAPVSVPRHRDPRDCAHHYRALLDEAVRVRLRLQGNAALLLSSGIDSSSVAAAVAGLRRQGVDAASRVAAYSMTIPGHPACEGRVIREVIERLGLPWEARPAREASAALLADEARASLDLPEPAVAAMMRPVSDAARAGGHTTLLTGYGGDDWFDTSYGELSDLLRRGRPGAAVRWLAAAARVPGHVPVREMVRQGIWMALTPRVRQAVRVALRRTPVAPWIDPRFAREQALHERLRRVQDDVAFDSIAHSDVFRAATNGDAALRGDVDERSAAARGLEYRHPLLDRRLIEFSLTLPPSLRCVGGMSKALMRQAMREHLPRSVTASPASDDFGFLGRRALAHLGGAAGLAGSRPVQRGWVTAEAVRVLYETLERGTTRALWPLVTLAAVDFWLGALEGTRDGRETWDHAQHQGSDSGPKQARASSPARAAAVQAACPH